MVRLDALRILTLGAAFFAAPTVHGADCTVLSYTFQPDCFRTAGDTGCVFQVNHLDFGPQIAVWLESADRTQFVDTLMVTNAVAIHGIGNRPGDPTLRSGPRFPYGRREMALPIWTHARGKLYEFVAMNDGMENELGYHENVSSPEPYFCRPMALSEIVDAITCPSGNFRSAKGLLEPNRKSYYPPRADLFNFGGTPCIARIGYPGSCDAGDSAQYFAINDVDVVAAATPPYGRPFTGKWVVPAGLPLGDYAVSVEVGKEFDTNAGHQYPNEVSQLDMNNFSGEGEPGNMGQPSVLFRVPFTLGATPVGTTASAIDIAGYGDWSGATGDVNVPDATINADPGSGVGRLRTFETPNGPARVAVSLGACSAVDCTASPTPLPIPVSFTANPLANGTAATVTLLQSSDSGGQPIVRYQVRYAVLPNSGAIDASSFAAWTAAGAVPVTVPGAATSLEIDGLTPQTYYGVGISATGVCGSSPPTFQSFTTPAIKYAQLSGCFIATAAFGSDLGPEVTMLRALRDGATSESALARTAVDLYYRSSPPLAATLARSSVGRALVRIGLRSLVR